MTRNAGKPLPFEDNLFLWVNGIFYWQNEWQIQYVIQNKADVTEVVVENMSYNVNTEFRLWQRYLKNGKPHRYGGKTNPPLVSNIDIGNAEIVYDIDGMHPIEYFLGQELPSVGLLPHPFIKIKNGESFLYMPMCLFVTNFLTSNRLLSESIFDSGGVYQYIDSDIVENRSLKIAFNERLLKRDFEKKEKVAAVAHIITTELLKCFNEFYTEMINGGSGRLIPYPVLTLPNLQQLSFRYFYQFRPHHYDHMIKDIEGVSFVPSVTEVRATHPLYDTVNLNSGEIRRVKVRRKKISDEVIIGGGNRPATPNPIVDVDSNMIAPYAAEMLNVELGGLSATNDDNSFVATDASYTSDEEIVQLSAGRGRYGGDGSQAEFDTSTLSDYEHLSRVQQFEQIVRNLKRERRLGDVGEIQYQTMPRTNKKVSWLSDSQQLRPVLFVKLTYNEREFLLVEMIVNSDEKNFGTGVLLIQIKESVEKTVKFVISVLNKNNGTWGYGRLEGCTYSTIKHHSSRTVTKFVDLIIEKLKEVTK